MIQIMRIWRLSLGMIAILSLLSGMGCKKKEPVTLPDPVLPTVTTSQVIEITTTTASCGGEVSTDGGAPVTVRGICWRTDQTPTILDHKTSDGTGTGSYTSLITGLDSNTTYYVRAYATNSAGTAYGDTVSFTRLIPDSIVYTEINPEILIKPVRYWDPPNLQYDCRQPVPWDSSAHYDIDADNDGTFDFRVNSDTWYEFHSASMPCMNFMLYSDITALGAANSVAVNNLIGHCADVIPPGQPVSDMLMYSEHAETVRVYWKSWSCNEECANGDNYFGFRMKKGSGYIYGWILMSLNQTEFQWTIKGFAINRTLNRKILAGQTQ